MFVLKAIGFVISRTLCYVCYIGRENIPSGPDGFIVAADHQTYVDPVWVTIPIFRKLRYMTFETAFTWPVVGKLIRYLGAFPVSLDGSRAKMLLRTSLTSLKEGAALMIFPEGAREFADGKPLEYRSGAMHIAIAAGCKVLPVTIEGGNRIWPRGQKYPKLFQLVTVTYHPPFTPISDDAEKETQRLFDIINSGRSH